MVLVLPNAATLSFSGNAQASCASAMSIAVVLIEGTNKCLEAPNTILFSPSTYGFSAMVARTSNRIKILETAAKAGRKQNSP